MNRDRGKSSYRWCLLLAGLSFPALGQEEPVPQEPATDVIAVTTQEPGAPLNLGANQILEITVTAQKKEEGINDVPIAISAFSGEDMAALGVTDTRDVAGLVPGFSANDSGQGTPIYTLRGVGYNDTTYTATGTVGIYTDEVSLPYSVMSKGLSVDVQRTEILKGPQGTLYGRNTTGGLINNIANKPTSFFEAGGTVGYGRFDTLDAEAFVSGPLTDTLNGRLAVHVLQAREGWQYSNTRPDDRLGEQDKFSGRGTLAWAPLESLALRLTLERWKDRSDPQAPQSVGINPQNGIFGSAALSPRVRDYPRVPLRGADPQVADWNPERDWQRNDRFASQVLRADWSVTEDTKLTTLVSHLKSEALGSDDIQSGYDFYNLESSTTAFIDTIAVETRLAGQWDDVVDWLVGVNVSRDRASEDHFVFIDTESAFFPVQAPFLAELAAAGIDLGDIANSIPGLPGQYAGIVEALENGSSPLTSRFNSQGQVYIRQRAAFLSTDWHLTEVLNLNLGARYTVNKQSYIGCSKESPESVGLGANNLSTFLSFLYATQFTLATGQPGNPSVAQQGDCFTVGEDGSRDPFRGQLDEENVSGRAALDWKPTEDILLYGSLTRGFKAGGFPVLNACCKYQFTPTRQEELLASELGGKLTFFGSRLQTNVSVFYYDYKDKQLMTKQDDPVFGPLPVLRNAPRSHVFGGEAEVQTRPFDGLFVSLAASYVKTQIDEFVSTNDAGDEQDFAGRPFNFSPKYEINLITDYSQPIGSLYLGGGVDVQRTGNTNGTLAQTPAYDLPSYTLLGARLHLSSPVDRWTVTLFGRNLTNEFYSVASFNIGDSIARFAGRPRSYGLSVSYRYF